MLSDWNREVAAARDAARLAGAEVLRQYHEFEQIPDAPAGITTAADHAAQEILLEALAGAFPGDAFLAEEDTPTLAHLPRAGRRVWILDPIDGTRGFARKTGEFSVMVGLVVEGRPVVGVVYEPARARLTWAARGSGCFREDAGAAQRTVVSPAERLEGTTLVMSRGSQERHARQVALFASAGAKFTYSAGIKLAMVARGEVDLYLGDYLGYSDWDLCAGDILVEEAGGRVTDRDGHLIPYAAPAGRSARGCLATNGLLHDAALSALRGAGL